MCENCCRSTSLKLSDEVIASFMTMLQLALLTGTDVCDWFRMIQLVLDPDNPTKLTLDPSYRAGLEAQITDLEKQAQEMLDAGQSTVGVN
jgi:hypothetical protein